MLRFIAFLALVFLTGTRAFADAAILKGLPKTGFNIVVENLDPDAKKAGLSEASLIKVIASRMAKRKVAYNTNADAQLFARIVVLTSYSVTNDVLGYGAHVELSLREKALLMRDKQTTFWAPTWFKGNVTVSNPKAFGVDVVKALATLSDQFLSDYLGTTATPK